MIPASAEVAAQRLRSIRADEQIHRFAAKKGEVLPVLEIHTSRYTERMCFEKKKKYPYNHSS